MTLSWSRVCKQTVCYFAQQAENQLVCIKKKKRRNYAIKESDLMWLASAERLYSERLSLLAQAVTYL